MREYPLSLVRVINAVDEDILGPNHKRLAIDIFMMNSRPEGCTLTAKQHAARLGMHAVKTVETMRWELEQYGLIRRADSRCAWYVSPPADCVPTGGAKDREILECALRLGDFLRPAVARRRTRFERNGNGIPRIVTEWSPQDGAPPESQGEGEELEDEDVSPWEATGG